MLFRSKGDRKVRGPLWSSANDVSLGGFSGSPGFVVREKHLHLVGFLRAGSKSDGGAPSVFPGVVLLSPARYLMADGRLDRAAMPWTLS